MAVGIQAERLASLISRIERLEEERKATSDDIREVYAEAKSAGYDTKVMRKVIAERKKDTAARQEEAALFDVYMHALGDLAGTPLANSALSRAGIEQPSA